MPQGVAVGPFPASTVVDGLLHVVAFDYDNPGRKDPQYLLVGRGNPLLSHLYPYRSGIASRIRGNPCFAAVVPLPHLLPLC